MTLNPDRKRNRKRIVQRTVARIPWRSSRLSIEQIESEFNGEEATDSMKRSARSAKQRKSRGEGEMSCDRANVSCELRKRIRSVGFANAETLVPQRGNPVTFSMGNSLSV